jgi:heme-degrading monooxygenase HmoA
MIERHITFNVLPDRTEAFERFFAERYRPPMVSFPGFVSASLLRAVEPTTTYVMVLRWADGESAAGWRTSPVHEALQPELVALHTGMTIQPFEVVA